MNCGVVWCYMYAYLYACMHACVQCMHVCAFVCGVWCWLIVIHAFDLCSDFVVCAMFVCDACARACACIFVRSCANEFGVM